MKVNSATRLRGHPMRIVETICVAKSWFVAYKTLSFAEF